jgi:TPR repeat protein
MSLSFLELYEKALSGNPVSQFNLAIRFDNGVGVEVNKLKAVEWYKKSASQGFDKAQFNLALMLEEGDGVKQDIKQAIIYYKKASEQGFSKAMYNLGLLYKNGEKVSYSFSKAMSYFWDAMQKGHISSKFQYALVTFKEEYFYDSFIAFDELIRNNLEDLTIEQKGVVYLYLSIMYNDGLFVKRNKVMAKKYLLNSYHCGNKDAEIFLKNKSNFC